MSAYAEESAGPPAGLAEMLGGGVGPEGDAGGMADSGGLDPDEKQVIQLLEQITSNEPDDAKSAQLAKIVADLYKLLADEQDTQIKALGGDPKQMRAMGKAYAQQGG
jgi:hypothetical protein